MVSLILAAFLGVVPSADRLVQRLGSRDFGEREAAAKSLRNLGSRAYPAVRAGLKSPQPEVVRRCEELIPAMQKATLRRPDHPARLAFAKVAGDTKVAIALYDSITDSPRRCGVLERLAAEPKAVGALYEAELRRHYDEASHPIDPDSFSGRLVLRRTEVSSDDRTLCLFLGSFPETAGKTFPKWEPLTRRGEYRNFLYSGIGYDKSVGMPAAHLKLLTAWVAVRDDSAAIAALMHWAAEHEGIRELLPLARSLAAKDKLPAPARAAALLLIGGLGEKSDSKVCEGYFRSEDVVAPESFDKKQPEMRLGDVAIAVALVLKGRHPGDFGYAALAATPETRGLEGQALLQYYFRLGFPDDKSRLASRTRAKALLGTDD